MAGFDMSSLGGMTDMMGSMPGGGDQSKKQKKINLGDEDPYIENPYENMGDPSKNSIRRVSGMGAAGGGNGLLGNGLALAEAIKQQRKKRGDSQDLTKGDLEKMANDQGLNGTEDTSNTPEYQGGGMSGYSGYY